VLLTYFLLEENPSMTMTLQVSSFLVCTMDQNRQLVIFGMIGLWAMILIFHWRAIAGNRHGRT